MIRLTRTRTAGAIPASFRGPGRITQSGKLISRRLASKDPLPSVWKPAKKQLRAETDGKCAYCEGKASHVAHGDVEHFRPKSVYWWLAYCYDNYVFACQICNQSFKSSKFPLAGTQLQAPIVPANASAAQIAALAPTLGVDPLDAAAVNAFELARAAELADIPDPYAVDPELLFTWRADDTLGEVEIQARDDAAATLRAFDAAQDCLGLNRQELKLWRYEVFSAVRVFVDARKDAGISAALRTQIDAQLARMMSVRGEFAGMVRFFVREVGGLPIQPA